MRHTFIGLLAGSMLAATAAADVFTMGPGFKDGIDYRLDGNATLVMDVTGIPSYGGFGDPNNYVLIVDLNTLLGLPAGNQVIIHGLSWDVSLEAYDPSWLSEITMSFATVGAPELFFAPGAGDSFPGTGTYTGAADFTDIGFSDIVLPNGTGEFNFHESFDDSSVAPDGLWRSGTLTWDLTVIPAPGTFALLGLGMIASRRR